MDTELVGFRINPELREKAAAVCAGLGLELNDVLRALVTRIARDGTLPFELATTPLAQVTPTPFRDYDPRLWTSIKPQVDAEVALNLLARYIAQCSCRLDQAQVSGTVDSKLVASLKKDRAAALKLRTTLDVADADAVRQILDHYGSQVRGGTD